MPPWTGVLLAGARAQGLARAFGHPNVGPHPKGIFAKHPRHLCAEHLGDGVVRKFHFDCYGQGTKLSD